MGSEILPQVQGLLLVLCCVVWPEYTTGFHCRIKPAGFNSSSVRHHIFGLCCSRDTHDVYFLLQFISADVYGVCSRLFCDFGDEFEVLDTTGEEPKEIFISNITQVRDKSHCVA